MQRRTLSIGMLAACPFPTHQGTQVFVRHLAEALHQAGHRVHLLTYGSVGPAPSASFCLHRASQPYLGTRSGPSFAKLRCDASLWLMAHRVLRQAHCDVIHAHNIEGLLIGLLLRRTAGRPVVFHSHNAMAAELPTYYAARLPRLAAHRLGADVLDPMARFADASIAFDAAHRHYLIAQGAAPHDVFVVPAGLDPEEMRRPQTDEVRRLSALLGPGPWVLYAGNPDAYQNLPLLWQAHAHWRATRPDVRLLVVSHHKPAAFKLPRPTPAGLVVYQHRNLAELQALHALATLGVCPRTLPTGVPIKVLNYLAAGLPVVACRTATQHLAAVGGMQKVAACPAAFASAVLQAVTHPRLPAADFSPYHIQAQTRLYEHVYAHAQRPRGRPPQRAITFKV